MGISFDSDSVSGGMPLGYVESTDTTTTAGVTYPAISFQIQKFKPTSNPTDAIRFTNISRYEYDTPYNNSGIGHHAAALNWYVHKGTGNSSLAYAHEAKVDNESASATISTVVGSEAQVSSNLGTITSFIGIQARITGNAGTIGTFTGFRPDVTSSSGTLGQIIGYEFPNLSAFSGANRQAFVNRDPAAPILSAAPIIDQSITYDSPAATGFTVTVPDKKQILLVMPSAAYASGTINLPAKAGVYDGQTLEITCTKAVTAITWGANGAAFVFGGPTSITAAQTIRFRYFLAVDWWIRI